MKSFSKKTATDSIILIRTLCARILMFNQLLGHASLSRIELATSKNCINRAAKLSRPSISKIDAKKSRRCFFVHDNTRTRNVMAVSPCAGLNSIWPSP